MVLVGAAILPHGALTFDGDLTNDNNECCKRRENLTPEFREKTERLYSGCCEVGQWVSAQNPDLVVLHTPHGLAPTRATIAAYTNDRAAGTAVWNDQWQEYKVDVSLDADVANALLKHLEQDGIKVEGLHCFSNTPAPLRWGEVIPLWYCTKFTKPGVKFIVLTHLREFLGEVDSTRLAVGHSLAAFLAALPTRVVFLVSGDLSHVYPTKCTDPLYLPDKRWNMPSGSNVSMDFENFIISWVLAAERKSEDYLDNQWDATKALTWIRKAARIDKQALSCGCHGFITLHGLLDDFCSKGGGITSRLLTVEAPSYYGMMAATFSLNL